MKRTDHPTNEQRFLASHTFVAVAGDPTVLRCTQCLRTWPAVVVEAVRYAVRVDAGELHEPIDEVRVVMLRIFAKKDPRLIAAVMALPDVEQLVRVTAEIAGPEAAAAARTIVTTTIATVEKQAAALATGEDN